MSGLIYPTFFLISFRVGLSSTCSFDAGDVARRRALDLADGRSTGVDRAERGPQEINQTRVYLRRVITVRSAATWQHHMR